MAGIDPDDSAPSGDPSETFDAGKALAAFAQIGISPQQVRDMRYDDFVNMSRAFGGKKSNAPTEDEYLDMIANLPQD